MRRKKRRNPNRYREAQTSLSMKEMQRSAAQKKDDAFWAKMRAVHSMGRAQRSYANKKRWEKMWDETGRRNPRRRYRLKRRNPHGAWKVIIGGKNSGIVETNYGFAKRYWKQRGKITGKRVKLVKMKGI